MDHRDRELLDKQMRRLHAAPRQGGTMIAVIVGVFLVGVTFGGLLFSSDEPFRVAANDAANGASDALGAAPLVGTLPISR
jgi:hypothetical protein